MPTQVQPIHPLPLPLTWEVASEAGLCSDHPLGSGLTEDGHGAFGLLTQRCQPAAQTTDERVNLLIGQPTVLPQNQLGERRVTGCISNPTVLSKYYIPFDKTLLRGLDL